MGAEPLLRIRWAGDAEKVEEEDEDEEEGFASGADVCPFDASLKLVAPGLLSSLLLPGSCCQTPTWGEK